MILILLTWELTEIQTLLCLHSDWAEGQHISLPFLPSIETCMAKAMQVKTLNSFLLFLSVDLVALPSLLVVNFLCKGVYD